MLAVALAAAAAVQPWAAVSPCQAVFFFPAPMEGWAWNLPTTPTNRMEYAWLVDVPIGKLRMRWGVSKFKLGGSPGRGSLSDLLSFAQTDAWDVTDAGDNHADRSSIVLARTVPKEGGLRVTVREPKLLSELYRLRPVEVGYMSVGRGVPKPQTFQVPVRYLDSLESVGEGSCPKGPNVL